VQDPPRGCVGPAFRPNGEVTVGGHFFGRPQRRGKWGNGPPSGLILLGLTPVIYLPKLSLGRWVLGLRWPLPKVPLGTVPKFGQAQNFDPRNLGFYKRNRAAEKCSGIPRPRAIQWYIELHYLNYRSCQAGGCGFGCFFSQSLLSICIWYYITIII
jgi:hypothetical protein